MIILFVERTTTTKIKLLIFQIQFKIIQAAWTSLVESYKQQQQNILAYLLNNKNKLQQLQQKKNNPVNESLLTDN